MTRILKSPLKHKDKDITAHPIDGIYSIERYHKKYPETSTATIQANKKKEEEEKKKKKEEEEALVLTDPTKEIKVESEEEKKRRLKREKKRLSDEEFRTTFEVYKGKPNWMLTEKEKKQSISIYTEGNNLGVYQKYGPKTPLTVADGEVTSDTQKEYKLAAKVTKSFDESGVGTQDVPLLVNMASAEKAADPLKPSGGFYKLNDNWYSSHDSNQQWAITNPSEISYLEEQLSLTNKLDWEELPSEYFDYLGTGEPILSEQEKADLWMENLTDEDKAEISVSESMNIGPQLVGVEEFLEKAKIVDERGGYLLFGELADHIKTSGNIEKQFTKSLNRQHEGRLYEGGYVSFDYTWGDNDDDVIITRVEREEVLKYFKSRYGRTPTKKEILFIAKNPYEMKVRGFKVDEIRLYIPGSEENEKGESLGLWNFHKQYKRFIKPSSKDKDDLKETIEQYLDFQDDWLEPYTHKDYVYPKDGKFVTERVRIKKDSDITFSEFRNSLKEITTETDMSTARLSGRDIKTSTRGAVTRKEVNRLDANGHWKGWSDPFYTGPPGWDQDKCAKYYAKCMMMEENNEIAKGVFERSLLKTDEQLEKGTSDKYKDVTEVNVEFGRDYEGVLTTEEQDALVKGMDPKDAVSINPYNKVVEDENIENDETQEILQ